MIHFKRPSVSPVDEEEEKVFAELEQLLSSGMMSSMIGWAICQGTAVAAPEGREEVVAIMEGLRGLHQGRALKNWAVFPEEGRHIIYMYEDNSHVLTTLV